MVTRTRASKPRQVRHQLKTHPPDGDPGVLIPESLHEALQLERDNLSKVEALLACMEASMKCEPNSLRGPYYPMVAQIARELVDRSIDGLDPFVLRRSLLNKVKEGFGITVANRSYAHLHRLHCSQEFSATFAPCG